MAAIEKIYGSEKEWKELSKWVVENKLPLIRYMNIIPVEKGPIALFPIEVDKWLLFHCPLKFVIDQIQEQYDGNIVPTEYLDCKEIMLCVDTVIDEINTEEDFKKYGYAHLHFEYRPEKDINYLISVWSEYKSKKT